MYFRDNKIISKAKYQARPKNKSRKAQSRKGPNTNRKNGVRNMKRIPHPSLTGMASGLTVATYLNRGTSGGKFAKPGDNVIKDVTEGDFVKAFNTLSTNSITMITDPNGQKTLALAAAVAGIGAIVRSRFPRLKLGGDKLYFRL